LASYLLVERTRKREKNLRTSSGEIFFDQRHRQRRAPLGQVVPTADLPAGITKRRFNPGFFRCTFPGIERPASQPGPVLNRLRQSHGASKKNETVCSVMTPIFGPERRKFVKNAW